MENNNNIAINKYITGELSGIELQNFEQRLRKDKALADEVQFYRELQLNLAEEYKNKTAIPEKERKKFKQILSSVMKSKKDRGKIISMIPWLVFSVALGAVALFFLLPPNLSKVADQYYLAYSYEAEPNLSSVKLDAGIKAYLNQDYQTALGIFNENPSGNLKLLIAKGNAEYQLKEYDDAVNTFNNVIKKSGNQTLKNTANWYLALTYLKKGDKENAEKILKLQSESSKYFIKASSLLEIL